MFIKFNVINTPTQDRTVLIDAETIHKVEFFERLKGDSKEHLADIYQRKEGYVRYTLKDQEQVASIETQLNQYANLRNLMKQPPTPIQPYPPYQPWFEPLTPLSPPWMQPNSPYQPFTYTVSQSANSGIETPVMSVTVDGINIKS